MTTPRIQLMGLASGAVAMVFGMWTPATAQGGPPPGTMRGPNPQDEADRRPAPAGALGQPGARLLPKNVPPAQGRARPLPPAAGPAVPGKAGKKPLTAADRRASKVAQKLVFFLQLIGEQDVKITQIRESAVLYEISWTAKAPAGSKEPTRASKAWLTLDGRYMTRRAVEIKPALKAWRLDRAFATCLKRKGARVMVVPGTQGTARQLQALGAYARELVIWCDKPHRKLCDAYSQGSYPRWLWQGGTVGQVLDRAAIAAKLGCKR